MEKPEAIWLGIDTMVMDNDDAHQSEGVSPTYKKVKGFQQLQVFWNRMVVDAIFRKGKAHSNHGNYVFRIPTELVRLIRCRCLDIAGKIVRTAGRTVLKITAAVQGSLQFMELGKRRVTITPILCWSRLIWTILTIQPILNALEGVIRSTGMSGNRSYLFI